MKKSQARRTLWIWHAATWAPPSTPRRQSS